LVRQKRLKEKRIRNKEPCRNIVLCCWN